jgi:molybdopterin molybdotransferase
MREDVEESPEVARVRRAAAAGANIRPRGEEIRAGEVALEAGRRVNPGALGFLLALGVERVAVRRRPRVAILATGNELVPAGEPLRPGAVRDTSTPTLAALVESAGAVAAPLPIAPDERAPLAERVREGLAHDVLVTTGGVSVGDYDFVKEVLAEQGVTIRFWRVAIKPGKPFVYGTRGETRVFGLPGNPGSSLATFERFVRPALRKMVGDPAWAPAEAEAVLDARCGNPGERTWLLRAALAWRGGALHARPLTGQGSGMLRSAGEANGFIVLPPGAVGEAGARVTVHVLPSVFGDVWGVNTEKGEAR